MLTKPTIGDIMHICCNLRDDDWEQIEKFSGARDLDRTIMDCHLMPGPKWAYRITDAQVNPVVVGGFIPQRKGVYQTWFLASKEGWELDPDKVTECAIERLDFMVKNGAHRLETLCLRSRKKAQRWYTTIGLAFESTLKGYCVDGDDAVMYVRVSNVHV
jgi:hypothetical protein